MEIARVSQNVPSLPPRFTIVIDGSVVCEIVKELSFLRQSYRLEGWPWSIGIDRLGWEYLLTDNGRQIMRFTRGSLKLGDKHQFHELDIADPCHQLLCFCVVLTVDIAVD